MPRRTVPRPRRTAPRLRLMEPRPPRALPRQRRAVLRGAGSVGGSGLGGDEINFSESFKKKRGNVSFLHKTYFITYFGQNIFKNPSAYQIISLQIASSRKILKSTGKVFFLFLYYYICSKW